MPFTIHAPTMWSQTRIVRPVFLVISLLMLSTVVGSASAVSQTYWPTNGWEVSQPEQQGMNSTALQEVIDYVENMNNSFRSMVVVRHGYIVLEEYFSPTLYDVNNTHALYSATKSFVSCLFGIAMDMGFIDNVSQKILEFFPTKTIANRDTMKESITLEHVLTMTSGFEWNESSYTSTDNDFFRMRASDDWAQYVLDRPMESEPGTTFHYNSGNSHLLATIINITTGMTPLAFADQYLFGPLGITRRAWLADPLGVNFGGADLALTPRDMAKLGLLFLQNGNWDGQQIVSEQWVTDSTQNRTTTYGWLNYGYQWWIDPEYGTISARGYMGQKIFILPDHNMVVVFTCDITNPTERYDDIVHDRIIAAILEPPEDQQIDLAIAGTIAVGVVIAMVAVFTLVRRTKLVKP